MIKYSVLTLLFVTTITCFAFGAMKLAPALLGAVALLAYVGGCLLYASKHFSD